jgi:hypothetical protein
VRESAKRILVEIISSRGKRAKVMCRQDGEKGGKEARGETEVLRAL